MDVNDRNLVTAPGDSDPQVPAAVSGSGVKAGSNVAGSLRSSFNDREGTGVASQAPTTLKTTSAEDASALGSTMTEIHRTTLADKLIASGNNAHGAKLEKLAGKTSEQLKKILEDKEKTERDCFDRIGRRLNVMLDAVREAKNVAKPVQTALAEAMNAYKQATSARKQRQQILDLLSEQASNAAAPAVAPNPTSTVEEIAAPSDEGTTKSLLSDRILEMKAIRHEVNDIRAAKGPVAPETWTEVVKKRQAKKQIPPTEGAPTRNAKPVVKKRFPALAKKIRGGVDRGVIGDSVVGMRQAKSGGLLIEVRGDQVKLEAVRAEISRSAGAEYEVRALQQKVLVEVRDLDQWTTVDEVMEAMATATGSPPESLKVVSLRKRYEGTQTALVSLPVGASRGVLSLGRLRVGMTMAERGITVAILSDYNRPMGDSEHWVESLDKKSAIFISGASDLVIWDKGAGMGFAWARINHVFFYSCYCTPNCTVQEFDLFLGGLEESIRNKPSTNIIVAGDFNSHSAEWGSARTDTRGSMLSDLISTLRLSVCNVGTRPTYRRVNAASVIDVTFERALPTYHPLVADWMVVEETYSASDHQYITYRVLAAASSTVTSGLVRSRVPGWSVRKLNPDAAAVFWELIGPPHPLPEGSPASQHAERLNVLLTASSDAAMPRRVKFKTRTSVHWWNDNIAELRKKAIATRRVYQRAGRRTGHNVRTAELEAYKKARADLKLAIRRAQEDS
ncbi:hypothetical protein QTP88_029726 [Uroleucon formosanum]